MLIVGCRNRPFPECQTTAKGRWSDSTPATPGGHGHAPRALHGGGTIYTFVGGPGFAGATGANSVVYVLQPGINVPARAATCLAALVPVPTGPSCAAHLNYTNRHSPIAVIRVGAGNDYGHPSAETLGRLSGRLILRNDEEGRIHLWSDGRQVWMEEEKG